MTPKHTEPPLSTRAALILFLAVASGSVAGILTYLAGHEWERALLFGLISSGGAFKVFNDAIGP
jgi:hypothetical protein